VIEGTWQRSVLALVAFVQAIALVSALAACSRTPVVDELPTQEPAALLAAIEDYVAELVELNEVPGLALAVIHEG